MKRVVGALNPKLAGFEASCFDGRYVTGDITRGRLRRHRTRSAGSKATKKTTCDHSRLALQSAQEGGR